MPGGRPPAPIEHHRRVGRSNGRKKANGDALPDPAVVVPLPMAEQTPVAPENLGNAGLEFWERTWNSPAVHWLSPDSDLERIASVARLIDDVEVARTKYRATLAHADAKSLAILSEQLGKGLSALGFDPTSRAKLGVAEVRRVSKLEQILENRQRREAQS